MAPENDETPTRQYQDWAPVSTAWRRWEPHITAFTWPVTIRLVDALGLAPGHRVLDVGCGIGDPALVLAMKIQPKGRVLAIDPVSEMIDTAKARAQSLGLRDMEFRRLAVEEFEAAPHSFDAVCGRWSFIFCADVHAAFRRVRAWLKPGGRFGVSTWTPLEESPGFHAINAAVTRHVHLPPPDPAKPGMLQLSEPGQLEQALIESGFHDVHVEPVRLSIFARDGDEYWNLMSQMGCSLNKLLARATEHQQNAIRSDVISAVEQFRTGDVLRIPALAQVAGATA